jgi:hypothetical protein
MINVRIALKEMEGLPVKIFKRGQAFSLAREIIMRVRPNIETSILRTLIFAEERKGGSNNTRLKFSRGQNIFVFPEKSGREEQRDA